MCGITTVKCKLHLLKRLGSGLHILHLLNSPCNAPKLIFAIVVVVVVFAVAAAAVGSAVGLRQRPAFASASAVASGAGSASSFGSRGLRRTRSQTPTGLVYYVSGAAHSSRICC